MSRVAFCPSCGAPLEGLWQHVAVVCRYCKVEVVPGGAGDPVPQRMPDDGRPRLSIAGRTYLVEGHLAAGESAEVYRGRWVVRLGELVILKIARHKPDGDALRHEAAFLRRLADSPAVGADHFARLLPTPIALAPVQVAGTERVVSVMQWRSGFHTSLQDAIEAFPDGLDGRVLVWIFKRLLELLAFTHRAGVLHGAVLPSHVLVHPRDHGAILVGWGAAVARTRGGAGLPLPRISKVHADIYPDDVRRGGPADRATDLAMAARCIERAAGARGLLVDRFGSLPAPIGRVVREASRGQHHDAWALRDRLDEIARQAYGPPRYSPLRMPGWGGTSAD